MLLPGKSGRPVAISAMVQPMLQICMCGCRKRCVMNGSTSRNGEHVTIVCLYALAHAHPLARALCLTVPSLTSTGGP